MGSSLFSSFMGMLVLLLLLLPASSVANYQYDDKEWNDILEILSFMGKFGMWGRTLAATNLTSLPRNATYFIPSNEAIYCMYHRMISIDPFIIPYHIVPHHVDFSGLQRLSIGTRLPTLVSSKYVTITNNSDSNFTIGDSLITNPDLYVSRNLSVQGITKFIDFPACSPYGLHRRFYSEEEEMLYTLGSF